MAVHSVLCLPVRGFRVGNVQPDSSFCRFSVAKDFCKMPRRGLVRRSHVNVASGKKVFDVILPESQSDKAEAPLDSGPVEGRHVDERLLSRIGIMLAFPALGLAMLDSSAVAQEVSGISPAMSVEWLPPFVPVLGDLDPGTAQLLTTFGGPVFNGFNLLFIFRIVMSWYPGIPVQKFPFFLVYNPTEPVLGPTRRLIPPVGGVDIAPVIWVALMSFANEVLLGKQGLLVLLSQQRP